MLKFIQCVPSNSQYIWQCEVQLTNFRKYGYSDKSINLIFIPFDRISYGTPIAWRQLQEKFPEAEFHYYFDTEGKVLQDICAIDYIPLLRLYCLREHFTLFPELEQSSIFYHDADIIFTRFLDFEPFLQDDICYLSNTGHYLNKEYFDSKIKDVMPHMLEEYKNIDVLDECAKFSGINRAIVEENNEGTGGAQYLLKGITAKFWADCYESCKKIRPYLQKEVGLKYFENENKNFQSWCADMYVLLHTLWRYGKKTVCPQELDFAWATDPIGKLETVYILHNAGVTGTVMEMNGENHVFLNKGAFNDKSYSPQKSKDLMDMITPKYCTRYYTDELMSVENPII